MQKTCVRSILTNAIEARADHRRTKSFLRTTEMKIRRQKKIHTDKTCMRGGKHNCRRASNDPVGRVFRERFAKIVRDGRSRTRQPLGRTPKR